MNDEEKYSVFIAEDEYPARKILTDFIAKRPELELTGIAKNGKQALQMLSEENNSEACRYDLLLFDIQLPVLSGIEVLERLENIPYVIFITAHNEYAVKAFEMGIIDYLIKPFTEIRFNQAIEKFLMFIRYNLAYDIYQGIQELKGPQKYEKSSLTIQDADLYASTLKKYMKEKKAYLDPEITLQKLAKDLSMSPFYISQVINQVMNMTYYDFLNGYRIEEAKKELSDPEKKHKSIIEILFEVGYKSKSVFNKAFKDYTGITPTEFRKKQNY